MFQLFTCSSCWLMRYRLNICKEADEVIFFKNSCLVFLNSHEHVDYGCILPIPVAVRSME